MPCCNRATRIAVAVAACLLVPAAVLARGLAAGPSGKPVFYSSLEAACEASVQDESPVLLVFSAEWCQPCQLLKKNTLDAPAFLEHVGALHIVDVDVDANGKVAQSFEVSAIPAMFFMTGDRKIISHRVGYADPTNLVDWITENRLRLSAGEWEGIASGSKLTDFVRKAAGDGLDASDTAKLVGMLDEPDPADRAAASRLLLAQREVAMPPLIEAVTNAYLGSRIAASELLHQLAPNAVFVDPWLSPGELQEIQNELRKWWAATGKLPATKTQAAPDAEAANSIEQALQNLRGEDTVKRTEAMSVLVNRSAAALPALREAIRKCERTGDHRSLAFLEDVRWAILIPDSLERRLGGIRAALARGNSLEQQAAASRLGSAGSEGIVPLAELAASSDPLVVEKAVKALSSIGEDNAIPAMAALLKSDDSNLRMTAAQSLAHLKSPQVVPQLITLLDDPNEVVVCTAVAGLEEVSENRVRGGSRSGQVGDALRHCLADTRWRVRAAAAEAIGKLRLTALAADVKKLLNDSDGFVAKTALLALRAMGAQPDAGQLEALTKRQPSLRGDAVEMMTESGGNGSGRYVLDIFTSGGTGDQVKILQTIARNVGEGQNNNDDGWGPLLERACSSKDVQVRRAAANALGACKQEEAVKLVERLLADEDRETREGAAERALKILAEGGNGGSGNRGRAFRYEGVVTYGSRQSGKQTKEAVSKEKVAAWHALLAKNADATPDFKMAMAIYLTGDGRTGLPELATAMQQLKNAPDWLEGNVMRLLLERLPLPEGDGVLKAITRTPGLFTVAAAQSAEAPAATEDYLLEPARFRSTLEPASGRILADALRETLGNNGGNDQKTWSLNQDDPKTRAIVSTLLQSTNAGWRAAALFVLGRRDASGNLSAFEAAMKDTNAWVRAAAVQGLARASEKNRTALETRLGPAISDTNNHVALIAAVSLLDPEVRNLAGLEWSFDRFEFSGTIVYMQHNFNMASDDRPLTQYDNKPDFLDAAKQKARSANDESLGIFTLLLAEYGETEGLDKMIAKPAGGSRQRSTSNEELLAGIALTHDTKYIPTLRKLAQTENNDYELRKYLQAIRGMSGPEARQFRLELNKQIRKTADNTSAE